MRRIRLDQVVITKEICLTIAESHRLIDAHQITVNGSIVTSHGFLVSKSDEVLHLESRKYVSRGGIKLEMALKYFDVDVSEKLVLDVGSSTGGFTDCVLQFGARKVVAVDVGKNLLHERLLGDERVVCLSEINVKQIRQLVSNKAIGFSELFDLVVVDLSFISLKVALPQLLVALREGGQLIALVKPQFEASRRETDQGRGVITDVEIHKRICEDVQQFATSIGCVVIGIIESPIRGQSGNTEFLLCIKYDRLDPQTSIDC